MHFLFESPFSKNVREKLFLVTMTQLLVCTCWMRVSRAATKYMHLEESQVIICWNKIYALYKNLIFGNNLPIEKTTKKKPNPQCKRCSSGLTDSQDKNFQDLYYRLALMVTSSARLERHLNNRKLMVSWGLVYHFMWCPNLRSML